MAIATGTALALGSMAVGVGTTAMSFIQAGNQKRLASQANADAEKAMEAARKKLEVNFYKGQSIKKEPYELETEALLSQGALATEAGAESERGAAVIAGKVQMAMNEGQAGIRTAKTADMTAIENKILAEDSRLSDVGVQLDLEEVAGANLATANASELAAQAETQGLQSAGQVVKQGISMIPLFSQDPRAQQADLAKMQLNSSQFQEIGNVAKGMGPASTTEGATNLDLEAIKNMTPQQFKEFKSGLTARQKNLLFKNTQDINNYNPFVYQ